VVNVVEAAASMALGTGTLLLFLPFFQKSLVAGKS